MKSLIEIEMAGGLQAHNRYHCHPDCPQLIYGGSCKVFNKSLNFGKHHGLKTIYARCQDCIDFQDQVENVVKAVEIEEQEEVKKGIRLPKMVWEKKKK